MISLLEELKRKTYQANLELVRKNLVIYTWGNASGIDHSKGLVVIKPSGVAYDAMTWQDMVVVEADTGRVVEGSLRPSSDTPTHLELYKAYPEIGGVVHTHSAYATVFAQAGRDIPALGTTHADYFHGPIPCTRSLKETEAAETYEGNTGKVILETVSALNQPVLAVPGIIVKNHGPFTWGKDPEEAACHAAILEKVAEMAFKTLLLNQESCLPPFILEKHYRRKHGEHAYYGQEKQ